MADDCALYTSSSGDGELNDEWDDYSDDEPKQITFKKLPLKPAPLSLVPPTTARSAQAPRQDFRYEPLDYRALSIRLIRLHPHKSKDGLIQCDLRHALIDDRYICLSYIWGDESRGEWIMLDGHRFWVRRNLFDFLRHARSKPHLQGKWL